MTDRFDERDQPAGFHQLEELVDRRLRQMPAPRAPETLLPGVLRAVRAAPAPAVSGWAGWPAIWQGAAGAALVVVLIGVIQIWPAIDATLALAWSRVIEAVGPYTSAVADAVSPFLTAGRVIWRVVVEPVGLFLVMFLAVMGVACAAFGTAWRHVAFGGITR